MINKRKTKAALKWGYSPARQTDTSAKQLSIQMARRRSLVSHGWEWEITDKQGLKVRMVIM